MVHKMNLNLLILIIGILDECETWDIIDQNCSVICNSSLDCSGNGLCLFSKCHCNPDAHGLHCEKLDVCYKTLCQNHGLCSHLDGKCICRNNYIGVYCEMLDCGPHGSFNYGTKTCMCNHGYTGTYCDTCLLHPNNIANKTFVCCPTGQSGSEYLHIAVSDQKIYKYLGGIVYSQSCIIPGHKTKSGIELDCSCGQENKQRSISSEISFLNVNPRMVKRMQFQSDPNILGWMIDDVDTIITTRKRDTTCTGPTNNTNTTGIALLVVMCTIVGIVFVAFITWAVWSSGVSKVNSQVQEELANPKVKSRKQSSKNSLKST